MKLIHTNTLTHSRVRINTHIYACFVKNTKEDCMNLKSFFFISKHASNRYRNIPNDSALRALSSVSSHFQE